MDLIYQKCPTRYRRWYRQYLAASLDQVHLHHAAADRSAKVTVRGDSHLVSRSPRTASRTLGDDEQHEVLAAGQAIARELPQFKFSSHARSKGSSKLFLE